tara:strand:+ start:156 stop:371 length:216 start_codon:yes stop_codon:yes gene_type:complete
MKVELNNLEKMDKYKENLLVSDDNIFSYLTNVAQIDHENRRIIVKKWYSVTTSKHINYVANEYGYTKEERF